MHDIVRYADLLQQMCSNHVHVGAFSQPSSCQKSHQLAKLSCVCLRNVAWDFAKETHVQFVVGVTNGTEKLQHLQKLGKIQRISQILCLLCQMQPYRPSSLSALVSLPVPPEIHKEVAFVKPAFGGVLALPSPIGSQPLLRSPGRLLHVLFCVDIASAWRAGRLALNCWRSRNQGSQRLHRTRLLQLLHCLLRSCRLRVRRVQHANGDVAAHTFELARLQVLHWLGGRGISQRVIHQGRCLLIRGREGVAAVILPWASPNRPIYCCLNDWWRSCRCTRHRCRCRSVLKELICHHGWGLNAL
mmetsp:Transcript_52307/g.124810  ORF Transcript_52307/g.124810 Transcript_52307/m.124810 type:complete len:301 (-) Transcript_52307:1464-2366(-)